MVTFRPDIEKGRVSFGARLQEPVLDTSSPQRYLTRYHPTQRRREQALDRAVETAPLKRCAVAGLV